MANYHLLNTPTISSIGEQNRLAMLKSFCRLCLEETEDFTSIHYTGNKFNTPPSIMIKSLVPELYTGVSLNPVVCYNCLQDLYSCYEFRLKCLKTENLIGTFLTETRNHASCIRLNDVVAFLKRKDQDQNQLTNPSYQDDCVFLNEDVSERQQIEKVPEKPTQKLIKVKILDPTANQEKIQPKPMLKPVDISKLMDPNKKGFFGIDMSPEKDLNLSNYSQNNDRSILKTLNTPRQDFEGNMNLPLSDSNQFVVFHDGNMGTGSHNVNDFNMPPSNRQMYPLMNLDSPPVLIQHPHNQLNTNQKVLKIAPKQVIVSKSQNQILKSALETPVDTDKPSEESVILKNVVVQPPSKPVILNKGFEPGDPVEKPISRIGLNNRIKLQCNSQLKKLKQSTIRTLNHEISFSETGIDFENLSMMPTAVILKPNSQAETQEKQKVRPQKQVQNINPGQSIKQVQSIRQSVKQVKLNPLSVTLSNDPSNSLTSSSNQGENRPFQFTIGQPYTAAASEEITEEIDIKPFTLELPATESVDSQVDRELTNLKSMFPREFSNPDSEATRSASEVSSLDRMPIHDDTDDEFCEDRPDLVHVVRRVNQATLNREINAVVPASNVQKPKDQKTGKKRTRIRKRLTLVPLEPHELQSMKKNKLPEQKKQIVRKNVTPGRYSEEANPNKNVVVLYTNFTKNGDYINDHDYLVSPYVRNKIYYRTNSGLWLCCCLICDLLQSSEDHISHMLKHSTTCTICNVDYQNVFILNLHVKCHTKKCDNCLQSITYPMHATHRKTCKKLVYGEITDSNTQISTPQPSLTMLPGLQNASVFQERQNTLEIPENVYMVSQNGLVEMFAPLDGATQESLDNSTRSRRYNRSPTPEDEEEACIYDKELKRFITPTMLKEKRLSRTYFPECEEDEIPLILLREAKKDLPTKTPIEIQDTQPEQNPTKPYAHIKVNIPEEILNQIPESTITSDKETSIINTLLEDQPFVHLPKVDDECPKYNINLSDFEFVPELSTTIDESESTLGDVLLNMRSTLQMKITSLTRLDNESPKSFESSASARKRRNRRKFNTRKTKKVRAAKARKLAGQDTQMTVDNDCAFLFKNDVIDLDIDESSQSVISEIGDDIILSNSGGTNTSQIEEQTSQVLQAGENISLEDTVPGAEKSDEQKAELVENPFSSRRSMRLRTRNEFTPAVLAASLEWRTSKKTQRSLDKPRETKENIQNLDEGQNVTDIVEETLNLDGNLEQAIEENLSMDEDLTEENPDMEPADRKLIKITILQNKLIKKLKKSKKAKARLDDVNLATELESLESEMLRIQEQIQMLKQLPTKKKKIKKIPKELKERIKEHSQEEFKHSENLVLEDDSTQDLLCGETVMDIDTEREISPVENADIPSETHTHDSTTSQSNLIKETNPNTQTMSPIGSDNINLPLVDSVTAEEKIEKDSAMDKTTIGDNSFEKQRGETMEEFYKRLEQTACDTSSQRRTRKRPRRSYEFISVLKRPRTSKLSLDNTKGKSRSFEKVLPSREVDNQSKTVVDSSLSFKDSVDNEIENSNVLKEQLQELESSEDNSEQPKVLGTEETVEKPVIQTPGFRENIIKPLNVKGKKKVPKDLIGYRKSKGRSGFGWSKKSRKVLTNKIKQTTKPTANSDNVEISAESTSKTDDLALKINEEIQDPYSFDTELDKIEETPLKFEKNKPSKINKPLNKPKKRSETNKTPAKVDQQTVVNTQLDTPETSTDLTSPSLQSLLQTMIRQAPTPKLNRKRSKVLKPGMKKRVRQGAKKVSKKTEVIKDSTMLKSSLEDLKEGKRTETEQKTENISYLGEAIQSPAEKPISELSLLKKPASIKKVRKRIKKVEGDTKKIIPSHKETVPDSEGIGKVEIHDTTTDLEITNDLLNVSDNVVNQPTLEAPKIEDKNDVDLLLMDAQSSSGLGLKQEEKECRKSRRTSRRKTFFEDSFETTKTEIEKPNIVKESLKTVGLREFRKSKTLSSSESNKKEGEDKSSVELTVVDLQPIESCETLKSSKVEKIEDNLSTEDSKININVSSKARKPCTCVMCDKIVDSNPEDQTTTCSDVPKTEQEFQSLENVLSNIIKPVKKKKVKPVSLKVKPKSRQLQIRVKPKTKVVKPNEIVLQEEKSEVTISHTKTDSKPSEGTKEIKKRKRGNDVEQKKLKRVREKVVVDKKEEESKDLGSKPDVEKENPEEELVVKELSQVLEISEKVTRRKQSARQIKRKPKISKNIEGDSSLNFEDSEMSSIKVVEDSNRVELTIDKSSLSQDESPPQRMEVDISETSKETSEITEESNESKILEECSSKEEQPSKSLEESPGSE